MKDTHIVLSISMLVSGREEMTKSLESLHDIREAIPCEVILVDTGCSPEYRAIAEKYADKIVNFEWCNDFAAARNVGLKEAQGEWFMYLDDDEWFEDPRPIVEFFVSGEYKQYKSATYIQRNYKDMQGDYYVDSYPSRLTELMPETRFVGKIHEYLAPYKMPQKDFAVFVHHYGYVYKDEEEGKQHSQRNILPLLEMKKENPGEPRWICQLAQEYLAIHEYEETLNICLEGLAEWQDRVLKEDYGYAPSHIGAVYVYLLIALESLKRYEEEEKWLEKALADPNIRIPKMQPTMAFLCVLGAKLYLNLKDYKRSAGFLRQYLGFVKSLKGNRAVLESGAAMIVSAVFQEPFLYDSVLDCVGAAIRAEDYALSEEALAIIDWEKEEWIPQGVWAQKILDALCSVSYHPTWVKLLRILCVRPQGVQEMTAIFVELEEQYAQEDEKKRENEAGQEAEEDEEAGAGPLKLLHLHHLIAELDIEHWYVLCMRILWNDEEADGDEACREKIVSLLTELFEKHRDGILAFPAGVWDVAKRCGLSVEGEIQKISRRKWKQMLERWCRMAPVKEICRWEEQLGIWQQPVAASGQPAASGKPAASGQPDLYKQLFSVKCVEGYLHHYEEACPEMDEMAQMLWRYADAVLAMYRPYLKEFVFEELRDILPEEVQLALGLKELEQCQDQRDDRKALEILRKCLGIYPPMDSEISAYAKMYRDDVQERNKEAREAQSELQMLIAMLKRTARQQIERGEYQAAKEILLQVQQVAPGDAEVQAMCSRLERGSSEP